MLWNLLKRPGPDPPHPPDLQFRLPAEFREPQPRPRSAPRPAGREDGLMPYENLLGGPPATFLLDDAEASAALKATTDPATVAARFPAYCAAWAELAAQALDRGDPVAAYAY